MCHKFLFVLSVCWFMSGGVACDFEVDCPTVAYPAFVISITGTYNSAAVKQYIESYDEWVDCSMQNSDYACTPDGQLKFIIDGVSVNTVDVQSQRTSGSCNYYKTQYGMFNANTHELSWQ